MVLSDYNILYIYIYICSLHYLYSTDSKPFPMLQASTLTKNAHSTKQRLKTIKLKNISDDIYTLITLYIIREFPILTVLVK